VIGFLGTGMLKLACWVVLNECFTWVDELKEALFLLLSPIREMLLLTCGWGTMVLLLTLTGCPMSLTELYRLREVLGGCTCMDSFCF
jgi:hypothetical protein